MSYELIAPRFYIKTTTNTKTGVVSKSWCYRYTLAGKTKEKLLGSVTGLGRVKVTQKQAEQRVVQFEALLASGQNPLGAVRKQRTFGSVYREHIQIMSERGKWTKDATGNVGNAVTWERWLKNDLAAIDKLQFNHPDMEQAVLDALAPSWGQKKGEDMVDAVARTFRRAIREKLWTGENPASRERMNDLLGPGRDTRSKKDGGDVTNMASLEYKLVPDIMARLSQDKAKGCGAVATRFGILTQARTGNIIMCRKQDIDRKARTWTIAAGGSEWGTRMKNGAEHTFYLNDQTMEIINARWDIHPSCDWLFSNDGTNPLPRGALNEKITKPCNRGGLGLKGKATMHGMRASAGTWALNEHTLYADVADAMLAHAEGKQNDKVKKAYQRGDAVAVMTELSRLWGLHCAGIDATNTVLFTPQRKAS